MFSVFLRSIMKRICFLTDSIFSIGGVQRVTAVIAKALSESFDVTIVTLDPPAMQDESLYELCESPIHYRFFSYPSIGWLKKKICKAYSGFYRTVQPQSRITSDLYAHSSFPSELRNALATELRSGHYDTIIGVHAPLAVRLATIRQQLPGVRLIGWIHNSFESLFNRGSAYIGPERKRHYVYQLCKLDETIVLCNHDAQSYRSYDHHCAPRVIYNPLTLKPGPISKGQSRQFLAVGRFTPRHKGFDLLIQAFHLFAQHDKNWTLHIVGEGPEENTYRELISHLHLEQRVILHPFTTDIQQYYSAAQVYVLSSRWEGFGLVLVEAMAHGLPVISSDLPTSLEIMGEAGIYFENGNIAQLAERMKEATLMDWPFKSAEALSVAHRFNLGDIALQWKSIL